MFGIKGKYNKKSKSLICLTDNQIFYSVSEAVNHYFPELNKAGAIGCVAKVCRGERLSYRGYKFKYLDNNKYNKFKPKDVKIKIKKETPTKLYIQNKMFPTKTECFRYLISKGYSETVLYKLNYINRDKMFIDLNNNYNCVAYDYQYFLNKSNNELFDAIIDNVYLKYKYILESKNNFIFFKNLSDLIREIYCDDVYEKIRKDKIFKKYKTFEINNKKIVNIKLTGKEELREKLTTLFNSNKDEYSGKRD